MKQKIKSGFIRRHMDDESIAKYEHMLEKRAENAEKLKSGMIGHLSALTDGVTAIFITVMMLSRISYLLAINAALIVLAFFYPQWAIPLYIILPIVSFFRAGKS